MEHDLLLLLGIAPVQVGVRSINGELHPWTAEAYDRLRASPDRTTLTVIPAGIRGRSASSLVSYSASLAPTASERPSSRPACRDAS